MPTADDRVWAAEVGRVACHVQVDAQVLGAEAAVQAVCHDWVDVQVLEAVEAVVQAVPMAVDRRAGEVVPMAAAVDGEVWVESMVLTVCRNYCTMDISGISPSRRVND